MAADNRIDPGMGFDLNWEGANPGLFHTVKEGDTLEGVARRFGITVPALLDANPNILELGRIQPGMAILIPEKLR